MKYVVKFCCILFQEIFWCCIFLNISHISHISYLGWMFNNSTYFTILYTLFHSTSLQMIGDLWQNQSLTWLALTLRPGPPCQLPAQEVQAVHCCKWPTRTQQWITSDPSPSQHAAKGWPLPSTEPEGPCPSAAGQLFSPLSSLMNSYCQPTSYCTAAVLC